MYLKTILCILTFILSLNNVKAQLPTFEVISIMKNPSDSNIVRLKSDTTLKRIFIYGGGSVNTSSDLTSSLSATQKFAARYVFAPFVERKIKNWSGWGIGLTGMISMNTLNLEPTGVSKDSIDFVSLMFPETGNAGFIFGPELTYFMKEKNGVYHQFACEISGSLRQNKVNNVLVIDSIGQVAASETVNFSLININIMPIKYTFHYQPEANLSTWFNWGLYYNFFNVPNEDAANFNRIFNEPMFDDEGEDSNINSIGMKISGGINGFEFFADLRYNVTTSGLQNDNPFKGMVFNAGFATSVTVFSK